MTGGVEPEVVDSDEIEPWSKEAGATGNDYVSNAAPFLFGQRQTVKRAPACVYADLDIVLRAARDLFTEEQRLILGIFGSRERDHQEHVAILEALEARDAAVAVDRMRKHLEGVADAIRRWDPADRPVS